MTFHLNQRVRRPALPELGHGRIVILYEEKRAARVLWDNGRSTLQALSALETEEMKW